MAKKTEAKAVKTIRITLVRSTIGKKPNHVATVKALGLGKLNSSVTKELNPAIMGQVQSIAHMVTWEELK